MLTDPAAAVVDCWCLTQSFQKCFVVLEVDSTGLWTLQTKTNQMYSVAVAAAVYLSQVVRKALSTLLVDFVVVRPVGQRARLMLVDFVAADSGSDQRPLLQKGTDPAPEVGSATDSRSLKPTAVRCQKSNPAVLLRYFGQTEHCLQVPGI